VLLTQTYLRPDVTTRVEETPAPGRLKGMRWLLAPGLLTVCFAIVAGEEARFRDTQPDTWVAADALHRKLPTATEAGAPKPDRTVGMFYFNWHAAFGTKQVHDISKILAANPTNPQWGPVQAAHYWGEPRFGYYRPDDPWIIRKHVQMLTDAGVDMLIMDVTNALTYDAERETFCKVLTEMKAEGRKVPQFALFAYANHVPTVTHLWKTFYQPGRYADLWFRWQGKPLLLTPTEGLPSEVRDFFTIRTSWAWSRGQTWFGDGKDRWPWLDFAPQTAGWHERPDKAEAVPVGVSQHPTSNIGRSFHGSKQPPPGQTRSGEGLYFDEQWRHALPLAPQFVFVTGWNEWVAQRFLGDGVIGFNGKILPVGQTFFVDLYDAEFSRDLEPMKGGYGDNYYWQLAANIRRYKGARQPPQPGPDRTIAVPGDFAQWQQVTPAYLDDINDVTHRDFGGVGDAGRYVNKTGRNDLDSFKVAQDARTIFFHASVRGTLTSSQDPDWMTLWLDTDQDSRTGRLGYDYRLNQARKSPDIATVEKWDGGRWVPHGQARLQVGRDQLHLAVDKRLLGLTEGTAVRFDFKWTDNVPDSGEGMDLLDHGDTAPNARFNYRFGG